MEPKIPMGSLIFVKSAAGYNVGDVITLKAGKNTVTHRIVGKNTENGEIIYKTKGDANEEADAEQTPAKNVVGKSFFTLPYVGYPIGYARTKTGFILLVIIPSTIIVYEELYKIKDEILKKFKNKREQKEKFAREDRVDDRIRIIEEEEATSVQPVQPVVKYQRPRPRKII
ncbi:MAG: signal peptidase I [Candidatus Moranbacteria bacterium RBG_13_45_13]|nr:MAG: signal peptidase I [Candidatus Moranbacteria bacterium RBG_13_45_13]